MSQPTDIKNIPGTYVFDKEHSRKGYHLNMFCMSLNRAANREAFRRSEEEYLDQFSVTAEQRQAVLDRDWLRMLQLGGNIYYTFKIAIFDRITMQAVGGAMSDMTEEEFKQVMLTGGKDLQGIPRDEPNTLLNHNG